MLAPQECQHSSGRLLSRRMRKDVPHQRGDCKQGQKKAQSGIAASASRLQVHW